MQDILCETMPFLPRTQLSSLLHSDDGFTLSILENSWPISSHLINSCGRKTSQVEIQNSQ